MIPEHVHLLPRSLSICLWAVAAGVLFGCSAAPTTVADLTPSTKTAPAAVKMSGSVVVRTSVPSETTRPTYVFIKTADWIDSQKLKAAIEQAIKNDAAFAGVEQNNGDYLLEVWVDKIQNVLDIAGEGFVFNFTSVWRLTRRQDGKVLACEFVKGRAGAHAMGQKAYPIAIGSAVRGMIEKGLQVITDQSEAHLSAQSTAGDRPPLPATP